ncbi:hypothetical protein JCM18750_25350 [Halostagnicola bangensis]
MLEKVCDRVGGLGTHIGGRRDRFLVEIEGHDIVSGLKHAVNDDLSHPSESDYAQLHTSGWAGG